MLVMLLIVWLVFSVFYVLWLVRKKPYRRRKLPKAIGTDLLDDDMKKKR